MGTVSVRRDLVEEWVRPAPLATAGDAVVVLDSTPGIDVEVAGSASPVLDSPAEAAVTAVGVSTVDPFAVLQSFPRPIASASIAFDNSTTTDTARVAGAQAVVPIVALNDVAVVMSGEAGVLLIQQGPVQVSVLADVEVDFTYYGDGSFPVFPYFLPVLFTDNVQNIQDAAALVELTGVGVVGAIDGYAEAVLPEFQGGVELIPRGSTPIFPWYLPAVFDDLPANVSLGAAVPEFDMGSPSVVVLTGESTVAINAPGSSLPSAVLPWRFPVILIGAA